MTTSHTQDIINAVMEARAMFETPTAADLPINLTDGFCDAQLAAVSTRQLTRLENDLPHVRGTPESIVIEDEDDSRCDGRTSSRAASDPLEQIVQMVADCRKNGSKVVMTLDEYRWIFHDDVDLEFYVLEELQDITALMEDYEYAEAVNTYIMHAIATWLRDIWAYVDYKLDGFHSTHIVLAPTPAQKRNAGQTEVRSLIDQLLPIYRNAKEAWTGRVLAQRTPTGITNTDSLGALPLRDNVACDFETAQDLRERLRTKIDNILEQRPVERDQEGAIAMVYEVHSAEDKDFKNDLRELWTLVQW